jgi:hypothetical protein
MVTGIHLDVKDNENAILYTTSMDATIKVPSNGREMERMFFVSIYSINFHLMLILCLSVL